MKAKSLILIIVGYKTYVGNSVCTPCNDDQYSNGTGGTSEAWCETCTVKSVVNAEKNGCLLCDWPSVINEAKNGCLLCNDSSVPNDAKNACLTCNASSVPNAAKNGCQLCVNQTVPNAAHSNCQCKPGYAGWLQGACAECSAGKWADGTQVSCEQCVSGKYSEQIGASNASQCSDCPLMSGNIFGAEPNVDVDSCYCIAGWTGLGANKMCAECAINTYKTASGNHACSLCPPNSESPIASTNSSHCQCNPGFFQLDAISGHATTCEKCVAAKYKVAHGGGPCTSCASDSNSSIGSNQASNCTCVRGFESVAGAECTACTAGKYKASTGNNSQMCIECANGKFSVHSAAASEEDCNACSSAGGEICDECGCTSKSDTLHVNFVDTCDLTQRSYFNPLTRSCTSCPYNKLIFRLPWKRSCEDRNVTLERLEYMQWNETQQEYQCVAGFEHAILPASNKHSMCRACNVGFYKEFHWQQTCLECASGTTTKHTGAISLRECLYCPKDMRIVHTQRSTAR